MKQKIAESNGFTLIEVLVCFALLSLMAVYAFQSFQVLEGFRLAGTQLEAQHEVGAVAHLLEKQISGAQVVFKKVGTEQQRLLFEGTLQSLHFVGNSDGARDAGGPYEIWIYVDQNGSLIERRQLIRLEHQGPVHEVILLNHVKSIFFAYQAASYALEETSHWNALDRLPKVVEVDIDFVAGDQRWWPGVTAKLFFAT